MKPHDRIRFLHMRDAIQAALRFVEGRSPADLGEDEMLCFALVRAVEIVGEAAARISPETRASFPELPWQAMIGMRNRLIHAYFDIDLEILWHTVEQALPELLQQIEAILTQETS